MRGFMLLFLTMFAFQITLGLERLRTACSAPQVSAAASGGPSAWPIAVPGPMHSLALISTCNHVHTPHIPPATSSQIKKNLEKQPAKGKSKAALAQITEPTARLSKGGLQEMTLSQTGNIEKQQPRVPWRCHQRQFQTYLFCSRVWYKKSNSINQMQWTETRN